MALTHVSLSTCTLFFFFFSSRRRHTRCSRDWSSDVCSSDLAAEIAAIKAIPRQEGVAEIRIPGERAYRERARLAREGIVVDRRIHDALIALAARKRQD